MPFAENFTNYARTRLVGAITNVATSLTVTTGDGAKFPATNFYLSVEAEVIWCASRTGDVITLTTRGAQGTTAAAHATNVFAIHGPLAHHLAGVATTGTVNTFTGLQTLNGGITVTGAVSLPATSITNAMLANSSVTVTAGAGLSGGGVVSLGGTITLTNAGVTSIVAGTGISINVATGAVTITNTAVTPFGTPAIVLGTAAAAGVATTAMRTDATIVAFDAVAPTTDAYGAAAAVGVAAVAARRDHVHGMVATPVTSATGSTGLSVSAATGAVTFTNTGVTSNVAGAGISVNVATGAVTITNTGVTTFNTRTGAVTLSSADVTTALGFTPANTTDARFTDARVGRWGQIEAHGTWTTVDQPTSWGGTFLNADITPPAVSTVAIQSGGSAQHYSWAMSLGSEYGAGWNAASYGMQVAIRRGAANPYIFIRFKEASANGAWQKAAAGYADIAGNANEAMDWMSVGP